jgi:hypothetical protein
MRDNGKEKESIRRVLSLATTSQVAFIAAYPKQWRNIIGSAIYEI